MAFSFKLPKLGTSGKEPSSAAMTISEGMSRPKKVSGKSASGAKGKSVIQQMKTLGALFGLLLLVIAALVFNDNLKSSQGTAYIAAAGEMRMLSQRLAKASAQALQGNPVAFEQLKDSRNAFAQLLEKLTSGGDIGEVGVPASPESVRPQLEALSVRWATTDKDAMTVVEQEKIWWR